MKKVLFPILALVLVLSFSLIPAALVGASPGPGLVGQWHFDEGPEEEPGIYTYDATGNGNTGTLMPPFSEGPAWATDSAFGAYALSFDGVNDYVWIANDTTLNPTSAITVEAWAKFNHVNDHQVLVRKMNTYSLQLTVGLNGAGARLEGWVKIGGAWKGVRGVPGALSIVANQWYHFAFTYDGAQLTTYVNGVFDRSNSVKGAIDSTTNMLNIGRCGPPEESYCYTNGIIDEVRIWDYALSGDEIEYNYSLGDVGIDIKPGSDPNSINLKSKGVVPVAILTTPDFDATTVDASTVTFGPGAATMVHKNAHLEDVDDDGDIDLILHFRTQETGIAPGDTEAELTGETYSHFPFRGSDSVRIVPPK